MDATLNGKDSFSLSFNASNRYYMIDVFEYDCKTSVTEALLPGPESVLGLGNGFKNVSTALEIDQTAIEGSTMWTKTKEGGHINFCVKMSLFADQNKSILINFLATQFEIDVNMQSGFSIERIIERDSPSDGGSKYLDYKDTIAAYQCNDSFSELMEPSPLTQGDFLQICTGVEDSNSQFGVGSFAAFTISQETNDNTPDTLVSVISNNGDDMAFPILTNVMCEGGICKLKFQLLGSFFEEAVVGNNLQIYGTVKLETKIRRRLEGDLDSFRNDVTFKKQRELNDENIQGSFNVEVPLSNGSKSGTVQRGEIAILFNFVIALTLWAV